MNVAVSSNETAQREAFRVIWVARAAGAIVALVLASISVYLHWGHLNSLKSIVQLLTVAFGFVIFVVLSTIARKGHARILERMLDEVRHLTEQLRIHAESDPLTGLHNLRSFQTHMNEALGQARRDDMPLTLVVADLDNFKVLNDSFGHQFGDEVLKATARVFSSCGGDAAFAARPGGDEFAMALPGTTREGATAIARRIESQLTSVIVDGRPTAALGSFGIGTYPDDGETTQALFAAADSRMYSEKHRRKAESLSNLTSASRKLFVRVGSAIRPDHTTAHILDDIAAATKEEFTLSLCAIVAPASARHEALTAVAAAHPEISDSFSALVASGSALQTDAVASVLPAEAWIIDTPVPGDTAGARMVLAGVPMASFRPDAPVVLALADLVQVVIVNGRAHADAQRAGRERDIHVDLAQVMAGGGTLRDRLRKVAEMIAKSIGVVSVSIEGIAQGNVYHQPYSTTSGVTEEFLDTWEITRRSDEGRQFILEIAQQAPTVFKPGSDERVPPREAELLTRGGISSIAVCAIRFDAQLLGIIGAATRKDGFFDEETMSALQSIADHLAPSIKISLLREELEATNAELQRTSRESLARLADAAEARDPHTGGHLRRIRAYCIDLSLELGLSREEAEAIGNASTVHDLGKLSLPDEVLLRPGKLSRDDWEKMREHPQHGERLIGDSPMFEVERAVARWHHERWDGSGYPDGLKGHEIPLPARIVAVADAFDALTTERPYKRAWSRDEAVAEIVRERGRLFCPVVVDALEQLHAMGRIEVNPRLDGHRHAETKAA